MPNNSTRRTKYEIWSELLDFCTREARTKSWLKKHLGLKTSTITKALEFLISRDLLKEENNYGKINYSTTRKGEDALSQYYLLITEFFISRKTKN